MGKVKAWIMDMEEDAIDMTLEEWTAKHGVDRDWETTICA